MDIWMDRQKDGWMETDRWAVFLWVRDWEETVTSSVSLLHSLVECPHALDS